MPWESIPFFLPAFLPWLTSRLPSFFHSFIIRSLFHRWQNKQIDRSTLYVFEEPYSKLQQSYEVVGLFVCRDMNTVISAMDHLAKPRNAKHMQNDYSTFIHSLVHANLAILGTVWVLYTLHKNIRILYETLRYEWDRQRIDVSLSSLLIAHRPQTCPLAVPDQFRCDLAIT